jgi:hypothetical protein
MHPVGMAVVTGPVDKTVGKNGGLMGIAGVISGRMTLLRQAEMTWLNGLRWRIVIYLQR